MAQYDASNRIWHGIQKPQTFGTEQRLGKVLIDILAKTPEKVTQINGDSGLKLTCGEVRRKSIQVATYLTNMGYKEGDRMMIACKNGPDVAPVLFGCFLIGAPINPIDGTFGKDDIIHMVKLLSPKMIFCDHDILKNIQDALEEIEYKAQFVTFNERDESALLINDFYETVVDEDNYEAPDLKEPSKLPAAIICTSGTTGPPKGVRLTHAYILQQLESCPPFIPTDILLTFSSIYWISGFTSVITTTFYSCTRLVTTERFSPKLMIDMIEKYRVTCVMAAPFHYAPVMKHPDALIADFSSLRVLTVGGAVVTVNFKQMMEKCWPEPLIRVIYGMTETMAFNSFTVDRNEPEGSVGVLAPKMSAKIIDSDGNCLPPNKTGEICLQLPEPFIGYFNNETATNEFIDSDNWMHTGDLGYFDDAGYLFIVGRMKDIIRFKIYQIFSSEVEEVIEQLDGVIACCVIGIPDPVYREIPAAAVVKSPTSQLTEEEVEKAVASKLSEEKHLKGGVYFVPALPRTLSGKVKTRAVQDMLVEFKEEK